MSTNELPIAFVSQGQVLAAGVLFPVVGTTIIGLRFWQRQRVRNRIGADDWCILAALVFSIAMGITLIYGMCEKGGKGRDEHD